MEIGLDIQMLTKCFGDGYKSNLENDSVAAETILSISNENIIDQLDIEKVINGIYALRTDNKTLQNVKIFLNASQLDKASSFKRIISYLKDKITFLDFLGGLLASDYQAIADFLLRRIYQNRFRERPLPITRAEIANRKTVHVLVKGLKQWIDSKCVPDPLKVIRKFALSYKSQMNREEDGSRKQRLADKYLGVIAVEIDSIPYCLSTHKFVTVQGLVSEFRRVTKMTTCPSLYEALLNIRLASYYSYSGQIDDAKDLVTYAMVLTQNTALCPEISNIWYETLNVYLNEFELTQDRENMKKVIQTGYQGIQTTCDSEFGIQQYWTSCFLIRMAFACLGIGIRGNNIPSVTLKEEDADLAQTCLAGVMEEILPMRHKMFYSLARGRYFQLKDDWAKAAFHMQEAKTLALKLGFAETKHILGPCKDEHA